MALIVEDGTGLATANAYIDRTFADTYHRERANTAWTGSASDKEAAILKATEYIDRAYSFRGSLVKDHASDPPQALAWPRLAAEDPEGRIVGETSVPVQVQRACAEAALAALVLGSLDGSYVTGRLIRSTERVGDMSTAATYDGGLSVGDIDADGSANPLDFPIVTAILRPVLADINPSLIRA